MRSLEDTVSEQRVDTQGEGSGTGSKRTVTRAYAKQQVNGKEKGKARK